MSRTPTQPWRKSEWLSKLRDTLKRELPNLNNLGTDLATTRQAAKQFNIPKETQADFIAELELLGYLPFSNRELITALLVFRHAQLSKHKQSFLKCKDLKGLRVLTLFELLLDMALQGCSLFPHDPAWLAQQCQHYLEKPSDDVDLFLPFLEMLVDAAGEKPRHGFNPYMAEDLQAVIVNEMQRKTGQVEQVYRSQDKLEEYRARLLDSAEFQADWATIKQNFPIKEYCGRTGLLRRTALRERGWPVADKPDFKSELFRFTCAFDIFCWKWCLYGMNGEKPMLEKLGYVITPYGTQIFIPAYWSFDPKRDLNWAKIKQLHNARGMPRQGRKLSQNRLQLIARSGKVRDAIARAKGLKLKGDQWHRFVTQEAGLPYDTDPRVLRRYVSGK